MSTVGTDGCLYNTQDFGTRYNDNTVTGESSVVRICDDDAGGGFIPHTTPNDDERFMKGSGKIKIGKGKTAQKSDWKFKISCDEADGKPKFKFEQKEHKTKSKFKLESITSVTCTDSGVGPGKGKATFDTLTLVGEGQLNGVSGTPIVVTLTDYGKRGKGVDTIDLDIDGGALTLVGTLTGGNHKAHK